MSNLQETGSRLPPAGQYQPHEVNGGRPRRLTLPHSTRNDVGSPGSSLFSDKVWMELTGRMGLSHREAEIVRGVFDDRTEFAIAADLGISPHTVHTHFERLHKKLVVMDRVQLVLCVTQEFLRLGFSSDNPQSSQRNPPTVHRPGDPACRQRQAA